MILLQHYIKILLWLLIGVSFLGYQLVFSLDYTLDESDRIFDRAQVVDQATEEQIESALLEFESQNNAQIILITLSSLEGRPPEEVALRFGRENGIGDGESDTGLVVLIALEDRVWRIEVGYGLEGLITDQQAYRLGQDILVPAFRAGDYSTGLLNITNELVAVLQGEKELSYPPDGGIENELGLFEVFVFGFFAAMFLGGMIASGKPSGTTKNVVSTVGSGLTGLVGVLVSTGWGLLIAIPLFLIWKLALNAKPGTGTAGGRGSGGGGFGGGSFSGGGFGGFGGGSFGGGGAGGSW